MRSEAISREGLIDCFALVQQYWGKRSTRRPPGPRPHPGSHFLASGVKADVAATEVGARWQSETWQKHGVRGRH